MTAIVNQNVDGAYLGKDGPPEVGFALAAYEDLEGTSATSRPLGSDRCR